LLHKVQQLFPLMANHRKRTIAQLEADYDGTGRGNGGGCGEGGGQGKGGRGGGSSGSGRGSRGGGGKVILNGVDVSNPNCIFSREEWDKLKGNWQYIWDKRAKKSGGNPAASCRCGQGQDASNLQARSIQALQQATSILSEITGALPPPPGPTGEEVTVDARNGFGEASYGGQQPRVHFAQGLPPGGCGGPRNASKVKTSDCRTINETNTSRYQADGPK